MDGRPSIADVVTVQELATMRVAGDGELRPWASIGEELGFSSDTVRRYGIQVLSSELLGRARRRVRVRPVSKWEHRGGCTRCGWTGGERNPVTPNGKCLWCNMEEQGIDLYKAVDSGLMQRMIEAVKVAMAGACPEPAEGASDG